MDSLEACQAREKMLRDFITHAQVSSGVCCCGDDMESHASAMICGHSPVDQWDWSVHCLLAQPTDDTALKAALAAERERCLAECEKIHARGFRETAFECIEAIRALGD